jgi:2-keto-4-pentenoate hydratase
LPDDAVVQTAVEVYVVNGLLAALLGWETLGWKIAETTAASAVLTACCGQVVG